LEELQESSAGERLATARTGRARDGKKINNHCGELGFRVKELIGRCYAVREAWGKSREGRETAKKDYLEIRLLLGKELSNIQTFTVSGDAGKLKENQRRSLIGNPDRAKIVGNQKQEVQEKLQIRAFGQ